MDTVVVAGASRGIGEAVTRHLSGRVKNLISVSRSPSKYGHWLQADLSTREGIDKVAQHLGEQPLDALLYIAGIWETHAFTAEYDFLTCSDEDIVQVLNVNLLAPIRLTQALLPALERAPNPKVVFMGSTSGLENFSAPEVAYTASKFGLRGAIHALREVLRPKRIGVTVINPGYVATPEVIEDLANEAIAGTEAIPLSDLLIVVDCVLALSRSTCIKEIDLPEMGGTGG